MLTNYNLPSVADGLTNMNVFFLNGTLGHNVVAGSRILEFPDVSFRVSSRISILARSIFPSWYQNPCLAGLLGLTSTKIYISQTRHKNVLCFITCYIIIDNLNKENFILLNRNWRIISQTGIIYWKEISQKHVHLYFLFKVRPIN